MKIYIIIHCYDVDGGFGDAIPDETPLFATKSKTKAEAYVAKYSNPEVYASPYADLYHHELRIKEINLKEPDINVDPWKNEDADDDW